MKISDNECGTNTTYIPNTTGGDIVVGRYVIPSSPLPLPHVGDCYKVASAYKLIKILIGKGLVDINTPQQFIDLMDATIEGLSLSHD